MANKGNPEDRILFTTVPLGKGMLVLRGSRPLRAITGSNFHYNEDFILIDKNGKPFNESSLDGKGEVEKLRDYIEEGNVQKSGLQLIGIPWIDRIAIFKFAYDELVKEKSQKESGFKVESLSVDTPIFSCFKAYVFEFKDIETGAFSSKPIENIIAVGNKDENDDVEAHTIKGPERIQITITLTCTVLIVDVRKALVSTIWYKPVTQMLKETCIQYCGTIGIDNLIKDGGKDLVKLLIKRNEEFLETFGVVMGKVTYNGYEFAGDNKDEVEKAMNEKAVASQRAQAKIVEANATAKQIELQGAAEAGKIKLLVEAAGSAENLRSLAIRDHQGTLVLGGGAMLSVSDDSSKSASNNGSSKPAGKNGDQK